MLDVPFSNINVGVQSHRFRFSVATGIKQSLKCCVSFLDFLGGLGGRTTKIRTVKKKTEL